MSSGEFQGNGSTSEPSPFCQRSLDTNTQSAEKQSDITGASKEISSRPAIGLDVSQSTYNSVPSATEKNELAQHRGEADQNIAESLHETLTPCHDEPYPSELIEHELETDSSLNRASEPNGKPDECLSQYRLVPSKEFTLKPSDFPLTKEKIAESLSLQKGCGFYTQIMESMRSGLRFMEKDMDQMSAGLQITIQEAQKMCILLECASRDEPKDIPSARAQADEIMYLLSTSFCSFEELDKYGKALKENLQEYSKQADNFHSSLDLLLEYLMNQILEKCGPTKTYV